MRLVIACVIAAGCGRVDFEPRSDATDAPLQDAALSAVEQRAYIKASNTAAGDLFGVGLALSADGSTLAAGAPGRASATGAAYVYRRTGATWIEEAFLQAGIPAVGDDFGLTVALSADGSTLAVGAYLAASESGAVYVFTRAGSTWSQQAMLVASNGDDGDRFGNRVVLSDDGNTLAAGAYFEGSGVPGNPADNSAPYAGAAYVFSRAGTTWTQQAYLKADNAAGDDLFGYSFAISADGNMLVIGAEEQSNQEGAAYVFTRAGTTWSQQAFLKAPDPVAPDDFGVYVALSADTSTIAVGAYGRDGARGGVYTYSRSGTTWVQQAYLNMSAVVPGDAFGTSVALSGDGNTLVVGAYGVSSDAGAVYVLTREADAWSQRAVVTPLNANVDDEFGLRVALSRSGGTLAVSAYQEDSAATGIDGDGSNNSAIDSGAVYIFE